MKRKIISTLFALVLALSFSLVTAVPAGAVEPPPNPTFATVSIPNMVTPSDEITIGWEREPAIAGMAYPIEGDSYSVTGAFSGTDAIHVTTSTQTSDFAMVIVPTNFTLSSDIPISYWGYTVAGDVKAPDEIYLFLDADDDGIVDILLTSHKPGPQAIDWYASWHEWTLTDEANDWHIVDPSEGYIPAELATYTTGTYSVLAIALTAGPSTTSGAVNVDVYFDRLTVNGNVLLDNDTGTIDVPEPFPGQLAPCIQDAIDAALPSDTITVAAGIYDELLTINVDGLTLLGSQANVDPRPMSGGRSGAESIIRKTYVIGTPALNPIKIEASNVTINGFTISPHYEEGVGDANGLNKDLVKQEPWGTNWVGTTISYNILTATGYNIVDNCDELVQLKGVTGAVIEYNYGYHATAEESGGNAFNIADGSTDSVIRNNEAYRCGDFQYAGKWGGAIYTYESDNISVIGNKVVEGGGITFGASKATNDTAWPPMRNAGGTVEGNIVENATFGLEIFADDVTVSGNDATGCGEYALNIIGNNVTVQGNNLCNSGTGILVEDKGEFLTSGVSINANNIYGNTFGLENLAAAEVDAENNWWGVANGPEHAGNTFNVGFQGDKVSGNVDYVPWLDDVYATGTSFAPVNNTTQDTEFSSIQAAIDDVQTQPGDTITVAAGTYTEAILIDKPLILRGATAGVNKNGYTVPADYAWDDTVESIINHPNPSGGYDAIVDIVDTNDVTFEGFVVQELDAVGNLNSSLVHVYAHTQEISNIVVRNNVIGPNTNTTSQDGAQGRMGLYIVNYPYSDQYGVVNSTFSGNKIFDCEGNGNNVFLWSSYHAYGAAGPASMSGTVIEDNEIYGSHRSGIETAGGFSGLTIRNNKIYGNSGLPSDDPGNLKYGNGILLIRGSSDKLGGPTTAFGPENLTIEDNEIYNNEKNGIYAGPINKNYTITGNKIHDNGWDGIMVDLEGQYWNPTFEDEPDPWNEHACYDGSENIAANLNNIYDNDEYGVRVIGTPTNGFVLDATRNWWGHASGPSRALHDKWVGKGDKVSDNVNYKPWLHKSKEKIVPKKMPAFARSVVLDNTGDYGWNTFSAPIFLDAEADTWKELCDLADLAYSVAYRFDSDIQEFVPLTTPDDYDISPGEGFFIKMNDAGSLSILYSTEENLIPPSRPLTAEWNLIGLASLKNMKVSDAFASIATVPGLAGYSQVVSPIGNAEQGPVLADGTIYVGESYWVYMLGERTLAGFTMTPVEWVP